MEYVYPLYHLVTNGFSCQIAHRHGHSGALQNGNVYQSTSSETFILTVMIGLTNTDILVKKSPHRFSANYSCHGDQGQPVQGYGHSRA